MRPAYDVGSVLPGDELDALPAGTSLLLSGPSMVGKRDLAIRMLADDENQTDDGVLLVTTKDDASAIVREFERLVSGFDPDRVGLIDCSGSADRDALREVATEHVGSPADLTGISIGAAKLTKQFSERGISDVRHGLVSVSTLLQYLDTETVFKFLHVYTNRVQSSDGLAVFTIDSSSHDAQTVNTMTSEFDGVVQLRETTEGVVEYRVRGFGRSPTGWASVE